MLLAICSSAAKICNKASKRTDLNDCFKKWECFKPGSRFIFCSIFRHASQAETVRFGLGKKFCGCHNYLGQIIVIDSALSKRTDLLFWVISEISAKNKSVIEKLPLFWVEKFFTKWSFALCVLLLLLTFETWHSCVISCSHCPNVIKLIWKSKFV